MGKKAVGFMLVVVVFLFTACEEKKSIEPEGPVHLTVAAFGISDSGLQTKLESKFPGIQFSFVTLKNGDMEKRIKEGNVPDLILDIDRDSIPPYLLDKVQYDMTPLIRKYNLHLESFEPGLIDHVKAYGDKGQLYALPYARYLYALFYNKNIFDKLHVPYPKNDMTWDDVVELAKKTTTQVDGVSYRGLDLFIGDLGFVSLMDQFTHNILDAKTDQAQVTNEAWTKMAQLIRTVYLIPGNQADPAKFVNPDAFFKNGRVAMAIGTQTNLFTNGAQNNKSLDIVTYPTMSASQKTMPGTRTLNVMISSTSKEKDKAFQVVAYLLSKEAQLANSRQGFGTVLHDPEVMKALGSDYPSVQGKNIQAFYKNELPKISGISKYEAHAYFVVAPHVRDLAFSDKKVSDVLNELNDQINKAVTSDKSKEPSTKQ
jgi:multiple sugar transport system substrate-binding protein